MLIAKIAAVFATLAAILTAGGWLATRFAKRPHMVLDGRNWSDVMAERALESPVPHETESDL